MSENSSEKRHVKTRTLNWNVPLCTWIAKLSLKWENRTKRGRYYLGNFETEKKCAGIFVSLRIYTRCKNTLSMYHRGVHYCIHSMAIMNTKRCRTEQHNIQCTSRMAQQYNCDDACATTMMSATTIGDGTMTMMWWADQWKIMRHKTKAVEWVSVFDALSLLCTFLALHAIS